MRHLTWTLLISTRVKTLVGEIKSLALTRSRSPPLHTVRLLRSPPLLRARAQVLSDRAPHLHGALGVRRLRSREREPHPFKRRAAAFFQPIKFVAVPRLDCFVLPPRNLHRLTRLENLALQQVHLEHVGDVRLQARQSGFLGLQLARGALPLAERVVSVRHRHANRRHHRQVLVQGLERSRELAHRASCQTRDANGGVSHLARAKRDVAPEQSGLAVRAAAPFHRVAVLALRELHALQTELAQRVRELLLALERSASLEGGDRQLLL